MQIKEIHKCRVCGSLDLISIGSFGNQYLTNFPDKIDKTLPQCPLNLMWCNSCNLLQLEHTANFDYLYKQYWYVSGINKTMKRDLADIVEKAEGLVQLKEDDIVIDIGSNDSTLLRAYKKGIRVGFEPAQNLMELAQGEGLTIINDYFNKEAFQKMVGKSKAKIITAAAMFYDLDNPGLFVRDMVECLNDDGIVIIQLNYLPILLEMNAFDNISHEHLE